MCIVNEIKEAVQAGDAQETDVVSAVLSNTTEEEKSFIRAWFVRVRMWLERISRSIMRTKRNRILFSFVGTLACLFLLLYTYNVVPWFHANDSADIPRQFTKVYSFVPEKLSKSAPVPISLPKGVTEDEAKSAITFDPVVKGSWVTEDIENVLLFKPDDELTVGRYYAVSLDAGGVQMSGDFLVDENPGVVTIFPKAGSETHESSEITIVFNRPMVPLTSLEVIEEKPLPITITPETRGKFKWVSTRNLQFIPETTLRPASEYHVEVGEGLTSVDGLAVSPFTHTFVTRPLRYATLYGDLIGYRSPFVVQFNQPVSLEKTRDKIRVTDSTGKVVTLHMEYGVRTTYDWKTERYQEEVNPSVLFVYQREDSHGRDRYWEFDTSYTLTIDGADTDMGTVPLTETRTVSFYTPNIVESITALSPRTSHVRPDLFDPEGTLVVKFYDEIDIDSLDVDVKGLRDVELGERCQTDKEGNERPGEDGCMKEPDPHTVIFSFDHTAFGKGEGFDLILNKVYTKEGDKISAEPYRISLKTYPEFVVTNITPKVGSADASLEHAFVCSSVPLRDLGEDESLKKYVTASDYIVYGRWYGSQYISRDNTWYTGVCNRGEFETELKYGLLPQIAYSLSFTLEDPFGQKVEATRSITTEAPKEKYTRLHNLQQAYNVTRPGRTKLTYAAENLETINLHICKMTPETFLGRTVKQYGSHDAPQDGECVQVIRDVIALPRRFWVNNYFQVDLSSYFEDVRGQYVVTLSSSLYTSETYDYNGSVTSREPLYDRTYVNVTNLAVIKKEVERVDVQGSLYEEWQRSSNPAGEKVRDAMLAGTSNLYMVSDSMSLAPLSGVTVTQFAYTGEEYEPTSMVSRKNGVTDGTGVARIPTEPRIGGAVIRNGVDTTVVSDWSDNFGYASRPESASRTYIYTDRPIYRPGQTVYVRGIDRIGYDGTYEVWEKDPVEVSVHDAEEKEIYTTELPVSQFGTFTTSFDIPKDTPLGTYRITAFGQSSYISVEEYVPAPFMFEMRSKEEEYMSGDTATVDVQADYYFGVPLDQGTVTYGITAQDYYFDRYTDEYFNFGSDWYSCYSCGYGDSFIARGEVRLDAKGHAVIAEKIDIATLFSEKTRGSKLVTVSATVKDRTGRAVSSSQSFIVHQASFYLGVRTDDYVAETGKSVTLRAKTVDTKGTPIRQKGLTLIVNKIDWDVFKRQEVDGGFYYRTEERRTEVKRSDFATDEKGDWSDTHIFEKGGEYEVVVKGKDEEGREVISKTRIYVVGGASVFTPPNNNYSLDVELEKQNLTVGDTASLLIKSPYPKAKALVAIERGAIYDYWVVDIVGGLYKHTFPVKESYAPNMTVSVTLLSPDPEVKFGSVDLWTTSDVHTLNVTVIPEKSTYLPGEEVKMSVLTTDTSGKPIPAEVSVAVADLSVLALRGNPKKDPFQFFYDGFPLSVSTASNIKNILYESEIPLGTKGGGGADPDDLAKKKRGTFKDTAYWNGSVITGQDGKGDIRFTLPDNLTTWQVESVGVTTDTKLGVDYREFTTRKELMTVPQKPRFILPGDTFSLGAQIFNQTDGDEKVTVTLESDSLTFLGEKEVTVSVEKGASALVYLPVRAPLEKREGTHAFTFTAKTSEYVDSVALDIPIMKNMVYETVATAHYTKAATATEYLFVPDTVVDDQGGLTINANATLAVFMNSALEYMAAYPYGCSEQIASALSTIALITRAREVPGIEGDESTVKDRFGVEKKVSDVVEEGLARIYEAQGIDGGFSYYKGTRSDLYLSQRIVLALHELSRAHYTIRSGVLERAVAFVETSAHAAYSQSPTAGMEGAVILSDYIVHTVGARASSRLDPLVKTFVGNKALVNEKLGTMALAYLALLTSDGFGDRERALVYDALTNRIDIDGRGAYLTNPKGRYTDMYETTIADTALLLHVFTERKDEHPMLGNVLRWLLQSRDRDGVWGSTQNTYMVIHAFVEYLAWQHETEAKFTLKGMLGGQELFSHAFGGANIFETFTQYVPMSTLPKNTITPLTFTRTEEGNVTTNLYYDMALKYYLPAAEVPSRDEGITVERGLYALTDVDEKKPLTKATVGDVVKGKIRLTIPDQYAHVAVSDFIPAGFEIVNLNLATEDATLLEGEGGEGEYENRSEYEYEGTMGSVPPPETSFFGTLTSRIRSFFGGTASVAQVPYAYYGDAYGDSTYNRSYTRTLYPTHVESHDDRVFLYVEHLEPGVYEYEYYLRALIPGEFAYMPAQAEELYYPEVFGRTSGNVFTIVNAE